MNATTGCRLWLTACSPTETGVPERDAAERAANIEPESSVWDYPEPGHVDEDDAYLGTGVGDRHRWLEAGVRCEEYFLTRNDGLQNRSMLYVQRGLDARLVINPKQWFEDGTVSLVRWVPGPDEKYLACGIQVGGSDWRTWRVLDAKTGELLKVTE